MAFSNNEPLMYLPPLEQVMYLTSKRTHPSKRLCPAAVKLGITCVCIPKGSIKISTNKTDDQYNNSDIVDRCIKR